MTLSQRVAELVQANVGSLYVQTAEADAASAELAQMYRRKGWRFVTWDFLRGLNSNGFDIDSGVTPIRVEMLTSASVTKSVNLPRAVRPRF